VASIKPGIAIILEASITVAAGACKCGPIATIAPLRTWISQLV